MDEAQPEKLSPFIFADPGGKRWPRLRLVLFVAAVLLFIGTVLFVQTLFVAPQLSLPFSLHQLKGQLKALQRANPAGQLPLNALLWEKFGAAREAAKKQLAPALSAAAKPRKKSADAEVRMGFYITGDA